MTGLLSRVAQDVYWAARYLERAEDTARIVREYTNLIIDLPTSATPGWEPLLAILDQNHPLAQPVAAPATAPPGIDTPVREAGRSHSSNPAPVPGITMVTGETAIVELLVSAAGNPSSIVQCVEQARQCLRRCREVIPSQAWIGVNDLHLFVASNRSDGPDRRSRIRFLDRIIADHQRLIGILATIMVRDSAFTLMRLGRHIERADMTTRLIDVQVGPLLAERPDRERTYDDHQWTGILQALSAAQMFHRTHREPMAAPAVVSFILHASNFPRSVAYCLLAAREGLRTLPRAELPLSAVEQALTALTAFDPSVATPENLHAKANALQQAIAQIHEQLDAVYFRRPITIS